MKSGDEILHFSVPAIEFTPDREAVEISKHLEHFIPLSEREPEKSDVVTFLAIDENENGTEKGFIINTRWDEGGLYRFISKSWILHSDLLILMEA